MEAGIQCSEQTECKPISSVEDLLAWTADKATHQPARLTRTPVTKFGHDGKRLLDSDQPRLLVCHDMKGGYLEDRLYGGHNEVSAYTFYHWPLVDEFVYFSHELVTVPPCCWVDAAHLHGVAIYGTLMTEFAAGAEICRHLLSSESTALAVVERLVAVARHHGLDGWLVNIENVVDAEQLPTLQLLLRRLTERMHEESPDSRVIWYDSVTRDGELRWQDQLNEQNECFFTLCDGIFLNYCWTPAGLAASRERAGPRRRDVYVGVDVFGRGCPGGGGFNAVQAVAESRWLGLSTALFAPGWTHERLGAALFPAAEDVLWGRLAPLLPVSGPASLPLVTSFCQGRGLRRYRNGEMTDPSPWHRLSRQQRQPCHLQRARPDDLPLTDADGHPTPAAFQLRCPVELRGKVQLEETGDRHDERSAEQCRIERLCAAGETPLQSGWQVHHTLEQAFDGGGCLTLANRSERAGVFRLFSCDLTPEPCSGGGASQLAVVYAVKPGADTSVDSCALCADTAHPADGVAPIRYILESATNPIVDASAPGVESGTSQVVCLRALAAHRLQEDLPPGALPGPPRGGWVVRMYRLPVRPGDMTIYISGRRHEVPTLRHVPGGDRPSRLRSIGMHLPAGGSVLLGYLAVHACAAEPHPVL